ncbi:Connector enhancer of kinase suppressor of ras 1 [Lonchura striata]|uniref:Connector enhancer of kinase suppressor of ras 1 n=1 Tax=Lonchura striata TaxID=40157 RepID=A0A218UKR2_9PASE|nr:Connector enhancer of kinase suppressor of ras 1 [Lonchura striata domestica]
MGLRLPAQVGAAPGAGVTPGVTRQRGHCQGDWSVAGLDAAVQGYPFEAWGLAGPDLLALDAGVLEALGVRPLGHQELLLEAAEQLRNLDTGLASTSLRTLTERLQELAQGIPSLVQAGLSAGDGPQPPSLTLLARVIDLVGAAKELFSWLNRSGAGEGIPGCWVPPTPGAELCLPPRYLFSTLNDFSASRDIILLCAQLAETLQACQHIVGICESIVGCSPPALLDRRAVLQRVGLALLPAPQGSPPTSPSTPTLPLGLRQSPPTSPDTPTLSPSQRSSPPGSPGTPTAPSDLVGSPQSLLTARLGFEITSTSSCLHFVSATTPEALAAHGDHILPGDEIVQVNEQVVVGWTPVNLARKLLEKGNEVTLVLKKIPLNLPGTPPSPRQQGSPSTGRRPKGVATRLSRRRVSCRDLGRVDCDGWLLKKKEHVGFMAQKWKRCWCVLKGHTLYWYNHPNDERAAGLINVATYNLESTREQKKKYVFQLCHQTYKPFVFAAETLADLSMWVGRLVTAKTKYTLAHQAVPDKEEDCYSETEAEDPDDETPRHGSDSPRKRLQNPAEKAQLSPASSPQGSPRPCSPMEPAGEDLESLARCLRQGGVSLMGQRRALTQEQCRKSFLRRNRNPHINERVHAVRALQSTLKAKLAELQALEQLLGEAALTSDTFRRWKEEHQELYQELREGWAGQQGQGQQQGAAGERHSPHGEAAEP